jgi:hypothetical protein
MTFDPNSLKPAKRKVEDPPQVAEGWRAADVDETELVGDAFIVNDPDNDLDEIPVVKP